jgi:hypothetical protein
MIYDTRIWLPLKDIPNQEGFKFVGLTKSLKEINCVVEKDENTSLHFIRYFDILQSWRYVYDKKN